MTAEVTVAKGYPDWEFDPEIREPIPGLLFTYVHDERTQAELRRASEQGRAMKAVKKAAAMVQAAAEEREARWAAEGRVVPRT